MGCAASTRDSPRDRAPHADSAEEDGSTPLHSVPSDRRGRAKSIAVLNEISERRRLSDLQLDQELQTQGLIDYTFGDPRTSIGEARTSPKSPNTTSPIRSPDSSSNSIRKQTSGVRSPDENPLAAEANLKKSLRRRSSLAPNLTASGRRRLSSVFGELSGQIDQFFERNRKTAPGDQAPDALDPRQGIANSGGSLSPPFTPDEGLPLERSKSASPGLDHDGDVQSSGSASNIAASAEHENLVRIYDELDPAGQGLTMASFRDGFLRLGYNPGETKTLEKLFKIADRKGTGLLNRTAFFGFFKHLPSMHADPGEESEDANVNLSKSVKLRHMSLWQTPVGFKDFRQSTRTSLSGRIKVLGVAPQQPIFAACDRYDHSIHLFHLRTGQLLKSLVGHTNSLLGVTFSADRKHVATASRDCKLIMWDATIGNELGRLQHPGIVTAVAFSQDGKAFFTGCQDNIIRRFSTNRRKLEAVMRPLPDSHLGVIVAMSVQHNCDTQITISRSNDKGAVVLDWQKLIPLMRLDGHEGLVWQTVYSHDDQYIATNCEKLVRVWKADTGALLHSFASDSPLGPNGAKVKLLGKSTRTKLWTTVQFVPAQFGNVLVACNTDTNMLLLDVVSGSLVLNVVFRYPIFALAASVEEPVVLCGDEAGNINELRLIA